MPGIRRSASQLNVDPAVIRQLQRHLGVPASGTYDLATARAVYDIDRSTSGVATRGFMRDRGLMVFGPGEELVPPGLQDLWNLHPSGLTVSIAANYPDHPNDNEFDYRSRAHAAQYHSVGVEGGQVVFGQPILIDRVEEVPQRIVEIVTAIRRLHQQEYAAAWACLGEVMCVPQLPPWCSVKNLSLFAHGIATGLSLNKKGRYSEGLHDGRSMSEGSPYNLNQGSTVRGFVQSVSDYLASDVDVQLFACSAGLSAGEKQNWNRPEAGPQGGEDSFAQHFLEALRAEGKDDATVFAHITAGHTTENFSARVFGARSEEVNGEGVISSLFDLVFPPDFVAAEKARLNFSSIEAVREKMWNRVAMPMMYQDGAPKGRMGAELFTDLDATRLKFQAKWKEKYP